MLIFVIYIYFFKLMLQMKEQRDRLRSLRRNENESGKETATERGNESGKGTETESGTEIEIETGMKEGTGTGGSREETILHRTAKAKEVIFPNFLFFAETFLFYFLRNKCFVVCFSGRKDDEMDPMDPSAYSDAPRYSISSTYCTVENLLALGLFLGWRNCEPREV